jgi:hypothetical protein
MNQTQRLNQQIQDVNKELTNLQPILDNITAITEDNYATTNTTGCRDALKHIESHDTPTVEDVKQAQNACEAVLNQTQNAARTEQSMWTYIEYWVSYIFTSHKITFDVPQQLDKQPQPSPPQAFKRTNTTTTYIQTYCDEPSTTSPPTPVSTIQ